ncbi:MAG: lysozyme inhibitor LprI family protein [Alphaproteobacteria bacterium]
MTMTYHRARTRIFLTWLVLACLTASGKSWAVDCASPMTQADMTQCALEDWKKADAELNAVYKKLMKKISPAGQKELRAVQRAWIAYRDRQCAFNNLGTVNGSVHPMLISQCTSDLTREQIKILREQAECGENDFTCGGQ